MCEEEIFIPIEDEIENFLEEAVYLQVHDDYKGLRKWVRSCDSLVDAYPDILKKASICTRQLLKRGFCLRIHPLVAKYLKENYNLSDLEKFKIKLLTKRA